MAQPQTGARADAAEHLPTEAGGPAEEGPRPCISSPQVEDGLGGALLVDKHVLAVHHGEGVEH